MIKILGMLKNIVECGCYEVEAVPAPEPKRRREECGCDEFEVIRPLEAFRDTVEVAIGLARDEELLVTVGVAPDRVETGFGHIEPGSSLPVDTNHQAFRVASFHEKPDAATARRYAAEGYLWNTGIFVWKASTFLGEVEAHAPEVAEHLPLLESSGPDAFFDAVPTCVVDQAVLDGAAHHLDRHLRALAEAAKGVPHALRVAVPHLP